MTSRWLSQERPHGEEYDRRFRDLEAAGSDVHGEASFVHDLDPSSVLDAGCGTGRVAIELARRGCSVVGVDLDPGMLTAARAKAPGLHWIEADLTTLDLLDESGSRRRFDVVVLAGNVLIFVAPGTEADAVARCAEHLLPGGRLVAGFQLVTGGYDLAALDTAAEAVGLVLAERYATWDREPWRPGGSYAVSVFLS